MIATTAERVINVTPEHINEQIRAKTRERIAYCAAVGLEAIDRRLAELDKEWDIERAIEANFAGVVLASGVLGLTSNRVWHLFSAVAAGFLLQHALEGWCPPVPVFRRLGFRTLKEIDEERFALKALRGDFDGVDQREGAPADRADLAHESARL